MVIVKKLFPVLAAATLLAGCASDITNLSPKRSYRNANGLVNLEASFTTKQQSLLWSSVKPSVVIGDQVYPMRQTPLMTNRWETVVPVPPNETVLYYRYKFDFKSMAFGAPPKPDSQLSPIYRLQMLEK